MTRAIALHRLGYRIAYRVLQLRWLLLRPRLRGVKCLILNGQHVLLVRHTYGPRGWDLPGGSARRGEAALAAAAREMQEELGLGSLAWQDLGTLRGRLYHRHDTVTVAGAAFDGRRLHVDPVELALARWFAPDGLPDRLNPMVRPILDNVDPGTVARFLPHQPG